MPGCARRIHRGPCVYPMIPIVVGIFGGRGASVSRGRALVLATLYVVGMGLMFAGLGVVFALIGKRSGSLLGDPKVVVPIVPNSEAVRGAKRCPSVGTRPSVKSKARSASVRTSTRPTSSSWWT